MHRRRGASENRRLSLKLPRLLTLLTPLALGAPGWPLAALAGAAPPPQAASEVALTGLVVDGSGAPIVGARVSLEAGGQRVETASGHDGRFRVSLAGPGGGTLRVASPGFAEATLPISAAGSALRIVLLPARLSETIAVTATRGATRLESAASVSVLTAGELLAAPAGALDDALRSTPGFSLFRRSSSRVANPTTQGVTLRGVSGSGASRTLVLADGLPLNDAFGSWVYWNRIPQAAIDRVEVVRGAAGDLYGADALGGVVQVFSVAPDRSRLRAIGELASHETRRGSLFGSAKLSGWAAAVAGEAQATAGVPVVARAERGRVDVPATSDYRTAQLSLGRAAGGWRAFLRGGVHAEDRGNGTPLQVNATDWRQLSAEAAGPLGGGAFVLRASGGNQTYTQSFSAIAADRAGERLTSAQRTPTSFQMASAQWSRAFSRHGVLFGAEARRADATNNETRFAATGSALGTTLSGGVERTLSLLARAGLKVGDSVTLGLGARVDAWDSDPRDANPPAQQARFVSPHGSLTWRASPVVALRASVSQAYRTPTLNELHREFRVGNVVTRPNPLLEPERLRGAEAGVLLSWPRLSARLTGFWNRLDGAVANVTLSSTPSLITRQRQNVSRLRAAGVEAEAEWRPLPRLAFSGLVAATDSRFRPSPALPELEDKRVPQVPRYQLGLGASFTDPRLLAAQLQLRVLGRQYDDDLNQFPLRGFVVLDASASRSLGGGLQAFLALENVFDAEYDVGRTPVRTVGWPRTLHAGLRLFRP